MALIDALRTVWRHRYTYDVLSAEQVGEAYEQIRQTVDAYDALQPTWSDAPEWATRYSVDKNGNAFWVDGSGRIEFAGFVDVPVGIDWRLCVWR